MKCEQCGTKNKKRSSFCENCGNSFKEEHDIVNSSETHINDKNSNNNAKIYIIIFLISVASYTILRIYLGFWIAIITIITGKIKCPNNKIINILFWLTIFFIILFVIFMIWIIEGLRNCSG